MHDEFEIELVRPLYERFGLLYYGCCEPLQRVIPYIKKLKNVRKISVSPWADIASSVDQLGKDYVCSLKPNPSFIATGKFDLDGMKQQIQTALDCCKEMGTPLELILKDISTVNENVKVLDEWEKVAMEMSQSF